MKKILLFLSVICFSSQIHCLSQYSEDRYLFWRPGTKLTFEMIDGPQPDTALVNKQLRQNIKHCIATGLWGVLDVPKTKKGRLLKVEKAYFCAAVDKTQSYWIVKDSTELRNAQLFWDICELSTRIARRNLQSAQTEANAKNGLTTTGVLSTVYYTCLNDGRSYGKKVSTMLCDGIYSQDEDNLKLMRHLTDSLLVELKDYATTEEEIQRFITDKSENGYKKAESIVGDLKGRGEIIY